MYVYSIRWVRAMKIGYMYGSVKIKAGHTSLGLMVQAWQDRNPDKVIKQVTLSAKKEQIQEYARVQGM